MAINNIFPRGKKSIPILWRLEKQDGTPYSIGGMGYRLSYRTAQGEQPVTSAVLSADGSQLSWILLPEEQNFFGAYSLRLELLDTRTDGNGERICDIHFHNAFYIRKADDPFVNDGGLVTSAYVAGDVIALTTVAEFGLFIQKIPLYAGSDGWWYFEGSPLRDDEGVPVPTHHSLTYDAVNETLIIDKDKTDADGRSCEVTITSIHEALVALRESILAQVDRVTNAIAESSSKIDEAIDKNTQKTEETIADAKLELTDSIKQYAQVFAGYTKTINNAVKKVEDAVAIVNQVADETIYGDEVDDAETPSELINATRACIEATEAARQVAASRTIVMEVVYEDGTSETFNMLAKRDEDQ